MIIGIGSDHGGFLLKEHLVSVLRKQGLEIRDFGPNDDRPVDYPDIAVKVALEVARGGVETGIMIDGAGVGSTMVANKVPGIRAALCNDLYTARNAREHNNANLLVMGSMVVGIGVAERIVDTFLKTAFAGGRHERRVKKIDSLDQHFRGEKAAESPTNLEEIISRIVQRFLFPAAPETAIGTPPPVTTLPLKGVGQTVARPVPDGPTGMARTNPKRSGTRAGTSSPRKLITEENIRQMVKEGQAVLEIGRQDIVTPLARDMLREKRIDIVIREGTVD